MGRGEWAVRSATGRRWGRRARSTALPTIALLLALAAELAGANGDIVLGQEGAPLEREVATIQDDLESLLGMTLRHPALVSEGVYMLDAGAVIQTGQDLDADRAVAAVLRERADGSRGWVGLSSPEEVLTADWSCVLVLGLDTLLAGSIKRRTIIAHELFHCFQTEMSRTAGVFDVGFQRQNRWLVEGLAEWAAEAYVGVVAVDPDSEDWWVSYLSDDVPLTSHDYAATGFFHYLDGLLRAEGRTLWGAIAPLAAIDDRTAALSYLFGLTGDIADLDGWPASLARQPSLGPLFDLAKPDGLPDASRTTPYAIVQHGGEWESRATPAAARLVRIVVGEVEPRSALIIRSDGPGAVGWPDGRPAARFDGGAAGPIRYCLGEACTCGETVRLARGDVLTPTIAYAGTSRTTILRVAITTCYGTPEEAIEAWLVDAGVDLSAFAYMGTCPVFGECVDAAATTLYSQLHPGRPAPTVYQIGVGGDFHPLWDLRLEQADDGSGWQVTRGCDHYSDSEACFAGLGQE